MSNKDKKQQLNIIMDQIVELQPEHRYHLMGYLDGVNEERQRWLDKTKKQEAAV